MKRFKITVNGKIYEVEVEELGGAAAAAPRAAAPVAVAAPAPAAPAAATPSAAPAPAPASPAADSKEVISAPMPGKIISIKVKAGQSVKAGDLICTLEAMKMENELFCSVDGTVREVRVSEGASVGAGEAIVVID